VEEDEEDAYLYIYIYQPKEFFKLMPFLQCNATLGIPLLERIFFFPSPSLSCGRNSFIGLLEISMKLQGDSKV
jgi:hypothetical protein